MSGANSSDDMTSFEVLHTAQNGPLESIDSGDFSFVPERTAPPVTSAVESHLNSHFDMTNMQSAFMSATPDLSVEEIHKRLIELLEENETMKEALKKNNVVMQEQLSTISAWHEQISLSKSKQRACLEKANEKISVLESENRSLKLQIQDLDSKVQAANENETCSKCKKFEAETSCLLGERDRLLEDKSFLKRELKMEKDFRTQLEHNIYGISNYLDNLQCDSKLLEAEKKELTALNNELQLKLAALDTQFNTSISTDEETGYEIVHQKQLKEETAVKESLLHLSASQEEIFELKKKVKEQNIEIESFKNHVQDLSEKILVYEQKQKEYETVSKSKFEVSQNELDLASSLVGKYKERCECLQQQIDDYQTEMAKVKNSTGHTIQQLQEEIRKLQETVDFCKRSKENDKSVLSETEGELQKLQAEYRIVTEMLKLKSKEEKEKAEEFDSTREKEAKNHLEEIDSLTARLFDMEQKLEERDEKVKELTSELNTVKEDAEAIPILKAQVEVYKSDLHNAVCARDSAHEEVEKLSHELKKMQAASSSANSGSSSPREKHHILKDKGRAKNKRAERESDLESSDGFCCPMCNFKFKTLDAIENHVNRCLDESQNPRF